MRHQGPGKSEFSLSRLPAAQTPGLEGTCADRGQSGGLNKNSPDVRDCVGCWHQEERDLCLQLSRHVGARVQSVIAQRHVNDPNARLEDGTSQLVVEKILHSTFRIPDCAADLELRAYDPHPNLWPEAQGTA